MWIKAVPRALYPYIWNTITPLTPYVVMDHFWRHELKGHFLGIIKRTGSEKMEKRSSAAGSVGAN